MPKSSSSSMLGRISRGLGHKTGKKGVKYRFDVVVEKLDNLPGPVKKCRVVWSRGPKLQMTEIRDLNKGAVAFKQKLSQIATMYQDAKGGWEAKEYKFQVQVPGKEDNKLLTVGRADLDMSLYVLSAGTAQSKMLPILFKVGMASTGYLKISITAEEVVGGTDSDDGMTEVSGMTGMTANVGDDQDLSGFEEDRSAHASSGPNSATTSRPSSRMSTAAVSPAKPEIKAAATAASKLSSSPATSRAKPGAKAAAQGPGDDEISPMSLSPESSGGASPRESGSKQPARAAGKPSIVDRKVAEDARAELFGTGKPTKPAASPSSSSFSSKQEPQLSEDDARATLFSTTTTSSSKQSSSVSTPAAGKHGKASSSSSSKQPAAPDPDSGMPSKSAAASAAFSAAAAATGVSTSSPVAGAGASGGAGVRRGLLDRSSLADKQQAQASSTAADSGPSSSKPAAFRNTHGHSLSDSDDDDSSATAQPALQAGLKQPSPAAVRTLQGTAAAASKAKQQQQPAMQPAAPPDGSSVAASKALSSENEKLKAQLLALRQQAAEAEESRRLAVLAADNASSERDEFRGQVQELQEQLKEALVSLMTQEEATEHKEELQGLRQQVETQQQQHDQQQLLHAAEVQAWQVERSQLQQAVDEAQAAAAKAQQDAAKQMQQLQANADSQEGLMRHLSWQLEAAQQALQQQQHDDNEQQQQQQQPPQPDVSSAAAPGCVLAQVAEDKACSAARILQFLADEVQVLSQQEAVHQCLTDQLLGEASSATGALELDGTVQGPVLEVLAGLRAAAAALQCQQAEQAALQQSVASLKAAVSKSQQEAESLQLLCSSQASTAAANIRKLHAEVTHLQQENVQLAMQQASAASTLKLGTLQPDDAQQQQGSPKTKAAMLSNKQPPGSLVGTSLIAAATAADTPCKACASLQEQLSAAQHKTTKLTAARDKLELILHDLEAASAEEREQLEHQLAAANKALRSSSQQLTSVQQQLKQALQDLADKEQQLGTAQQELQAAQRDLADKEQQVGAAEQQLEAAQQQLTRLHELPELPQPSESPQEARGNTPPPPSYAAATGASAQAATTESAMQVIAMAESAGPSGVEQALSAAQEQVADLQRQLAEAEGVRRGLEKDLARARKQLADEQSDRNTLEEHIITRLEDSGDDVAQETVAAYEAKYNRLKSRYRELTELHSEEVDKLHDEINTLQERVVELEALAAQLEAARTQAQHGEVTLADTLAKASRATSELTTLRSENQMLTQSLIAIKMELALCCEREVIGRHELYKARETNLKLASKMTKLETLVYANKK